MEDILSSIRRVIARDEAPGNVREAAVPGEDILDLHDEDAAAPTREELVSAKSADAARQSLEALSAAIEPGAAPAPASPTPAARTMEDVVLDALRPMLKDWLDTNLPPLVETMVAKEISRITGRKS